MRAAVFSDVHGNLVALEAVLSAAEAVGVEEHWIVGDHAAHGPQPAAVISRIRDLTSSLVVRGNTDRYVVTADRSSLVPATLSGLSAEDVRLLLDSETSHAWTRGAIAATGHYDWLAGLPVEQRTRLPDGTSVLLVHASPGRDDGRGITADQSDNELLTDRGLRDCGASLVFTGHTHRPHDRQLRGVRVVNVGSVSLPFGQDRGATWTLLTADRSGYRIEHRVESYSVAAVHRAIDAAHYPTPDWLKSKFPTDSPDEPEVR